MSLHRKRRRPRIVGLAPGTLQIDPESPKPRIRVMAYGPDRLVEEAVDDPEALRRLIGQYPVIWVNVDGLGDESKLLALADLFGIHLLALEDVVNTSQRPKVEEYPDHLFVVAHMAPDASAQSTLLETEQLSLFLGRHFVVTFQDGRPGDCFEPVRQRLRGGVGRIRRAGGDYLAYSLLDAVVDAWFPVLDAFGSRLHRLEESVLARPSKSHMAQIRAVKWQLLTMLRASLPLRDVFTSLMRETHDLVRPETRLFLRDCHDHATRIVEEAEMYRDLDTSLMELYLSSVSNKTNEVMKVLTVISAVFIPLTFVVGVYGMNFDPAASPWNMPELQWRYGYLMALGVMALIGTVQIAFFWRRGWLGRTDEAETDDSESGDRVRAHHVDPYRGE